MNDLNPPPDDRISALADGALTASERAQALQTILANAQGMQSWHAYHVVGDVLRSAELAPQGDGLAFWERVSQEIVLEPQSALQEVAPYGVQLPLRASANDAVWRWKLVAGVACAALGGVVGLSLWENASSPVQLADSRNTALPAMTVVQGRNGPMLRDPQLDSLIAAHQQLSGHSALQVPAGFLRNATYDGAER